MIEKVESCFEGGEGAGGNGLTQLSGRISSQFRAACDLPLAPANVQNAVTVPQLYAFVLFPPGEQSPNNGSCHLGARFLCRGPQPVLLSD